MEGLEQRNIYPPYSARTSLELPTDAALLFLIARGSLAYGNINFEIVEPTEDTSKIAVIIDVRYWSLDARSRINICKLRREEGAMGVGIYVCHCGSIIGIPLTLFVMTDTPEVATSL